MHRINNIAPQKNQTGSAFFIITPLILLALNWLWAQIFAFANHQFPNTANIPSTSLQALIGFVLSHLAQFGGALIIYLITFWFFSLIVQIILKRLSNSSAAITLRLHFFSPTILGLVLLNAIALVPMTMLSYRIPLASLIKLPDFISQVLLEKSAIGLAVTGGLVVYSLILIKCGQVIPNIMAGQSFRQAFKNSWQNVTWYQVLRFIGAVIANLVALAIFAAILYGVQKLVEIIALPLARHSANVLMVIFTAGIYALTTWFIWQINRHILNPNRLAFNLRQHLGLGSRLLTGLILLGCGIFVVTSENSWLPTVNRQPIVISHRGVNGDNGLPNSLESLKNTIKSAHPAYIETDVQLTKDNQFIILHDTNLKVLTGVNNTPAELTLNQITKLTMHIDGEKAKVPSLHEYLDYATTHHQPLLIELKTSMVANKKTLTAFLKEFGPELAKNHAILHSLNKNLVQNVKENDNKIKIGFILPYNTDTLPKGKNAFYTVEYSTLTPQLVRDIHAQKKQVYAWTANDRPSMYWLSVMNVDAIITDYPSRLQSILKEQQNHPHYGVALLRYFFTIQHTL
ncbi:glycerophosphodiester phosphodiesterase [Periweissella ghanensis]|uniref:GP-PDE domain-containing protein n=1 Tax=Periweissella ghanensis TaxID=467997 RepID=A0ABM8Z8G2_9LACO|nr:glycerophosphodiester phosphodiesterase [Periweissella ghanensis]MCM0600962.1 glycerophosphodiester phosphodiesterase [Periweissella ghanensis]CAH0417620.1 hypothetical protein WGH24286_00032 [Periweissella ghanensis]